MLFIIGIGEGVSYYIHRRLPTLMLMVYTCSLLPLIPHMGSTVPIKIVLLYVYVSACLYYNYFGGKNNRLTLTSIVCLKLSSCLILDISTDVENTLIYSYSHWYNIMTQDNS